MKLLFLMSLILVSTSSFGGPGTVGGGPRDRFAERMSLRQFDSDLIVRGDLGRDRGLLKVSSDELESLNIITTNMPVSESINFFVSESDNYDSEELDIKIFTGIKDIQEIKLIDGTVIKVNSEGSEFR